MENGKTYKLDVTIDGLPAMYNAIGMRSHWVKRKNTQEWKERVRDAVYETLPDTPLTKAKCTLTRYSSSEPDFDGLVHGMKPVIDGLVDSEVLIDDAMSVIGCPTYIWAKSKRGQGKIRIQVEEVQ